MKKLWRKFRNLDAVEQVITLQNHVYDLEDEFAEALVALEVLDPDQDHYDRTYGWEVWSACQEPGCCSNFLT